jgi:hypothetical protein
VPALALVTPQPWEVLGGAQQRIGVARAADLDQQADAARALLARSLSAVNTATQLLLHNARSARAMAHFLCGLLEAARQEGGGGGECGGGGGEGGSGGSSSSSSSGLAVRV